MPGKPAFDSIRFPMLLLYTVTRAFKATNPISGREHEFHSRDTFVCDSGQTGDTVTIEFEDSLLLVDRSTFERCCKWKNEGVPL
jgi:hypothetical protein